MNHVTPGDLGQAVLDRGANVNARGGQYGSALNAAVVGGFSDIVKVLIDSGTNVNASEGKYGSALNAAIVRGFWDIVEVLLNAGAKPDCQLLPEPDEEWLARVREEHGRGVVERYHKFWEVHKD